MFAKVSSQKLRQLAEELERIGKQEPPPGEEGAHAFARGLAAYMRCELTDRSWKNDETE